MRGEANCHNKHCQRRSKLRLKPARCSVEHERQSERIGMTRSAAVRLPQIPALSWDDCRLLVESVSDYAIFMLDPGGFVATWNAGSQRIKGYSPEEIIGRHFSMFYTPEDRAAEKP